MSRHMNITQRRGMIRWLLMLCLLISFLTVWNAGDAQAAVKLSRTKKTLEVGGSFRLKLKGYRKKKAPTWKISNRKVLSMTKINDNQYQFTALKKGTARVIVRAGRKKYVCKVSVRDAFFAVDKEEVNIKGENTATVVVQYMGDGYVNWKVSDASVAKCKWGSDWNGNRINLSITGLKNGTTELVLTCDGSKKKLPITINVSGIDPE